MVEQGQLGVLVVDRESEFAPVKDANGPALTSFGYPAEPLPDTPDYAKRQVLKESTKWLEVARADGLKIDADTVGNVEVGFLLSYSGENLTWLKHLYKRAPISGKAGYLNFEGEFFEASEEAAIQ